MTSWRWVPPPSWPTPEPGWCPPAGWQPDPAWGPAPDGWQFWQPAPTRLSPLRRKSVQLVAAGAAGLVVGALLASGGDSGVDPAAVAASASTLSSAESEVTRLRADLAQATSQAEQAQQQATEAQAQLADADARAAAAEKRAGEADAQAAAARDAADAAEAQAAAAPKPASKPAKARPQSAVPTVLLETSGNGIKSTPEFVTTGEWELHYTYDCSGFGFDGILQIYLKDGDGDLVDVLANDMGASGGDTTVQQKAGTYTLQMNSSCSWTVRVTG